MSGSATFTSDDGKQEELRAGQKRQTTQKETIHNELGNRGRGLKGQMGHQPLTWADSWVFAGEDVCLAVGTVDDLQ